MATVVLRRRLSKAESLFPFDKVRVPMAFASGINDLPPETCNFGADVVGQKPPLKIGWAASLDYPAGGPHVWTLTSEIGHLVVAGLETFAGQAAAAPTATEAAGLLAIGGVHQDSVANRIKDQMKHGYSLGVVLGANGSKPAYVSSLFVRHDPSQGALDPEQKKSLQDAFNLALEAGYRTARVLNPSQRRNLISFLHTRMHSDTPANRDAWKRWSERKKQDYYHDAAAEFEAVYIR